MMIQLTPIVCKAKNKWYKPKKSQEIGIKLTITDCSNFENRCSGAHFVSFLSYYNCTLFDKQGNTGNSITASYFYFWTFIFVPNFSLSIYFLLLFLVIYFAIMLLKV